LLTRRDGGKFTSPLFNLARRLKSHPELKHRTGKDAFTYLEAAINPEWGKLFPNVPLPSLEFVTAWEQINIPHGTPPLEIVRKHLGVPLKLRAEPICEGYHCYLAVAFYLQRLTPRRDILLPVETLSGILTSELGKAVSAQSVSYYCRQAKIDGYLKLIAKAHHSSGKAARYRFDLSRFTEGGEELEDVDNTAGLTPLTGHFNHGNHGSHGNHGIHGSHGKEDCSSSCVPQHAKTNEQTKNNNRIGEKIKIEKQNKKTKIENKDLTTNDDAGGDIESVSKTATHGTCAQAGQTLTVKQKKKKKKKLKRASVVALWQSIMCSRFGWQEKLSDEEYTMLVKFGKRTDEFAYLILQWTMDNWEEFVERSGVVNRWNARRSPM